MRDIQHDYPGKGNVLKFFHEWYLEDDRMDVVEELQQMQRSVKERLMRFATEDNLMWVYVLIPLLPIRDLFLLATTIATWETYSLTIRFTKSCLWTGPPCYQAKLLVLYQSMHLTQF